MIGTNDWDTWTSVWLAGAAVPGQRTRERHRAAVARWQARLAAPIEAVIALLALVMIGLALHHAANALERGLGGCVAMAILLSWLVHARARAAVERSLAH